MRYHPSLTRQAVVDFGPSKIALMIASEFLQASQKAEFKHDVIASYNRARELMGVLETIDFEETVASKLLPFYRLCSLNELFREERLDSFFIKHFAEFVSEAFEDAAHYLQQMDPRQRHSGMTETNNA